ncbi:MULTISPECIES: hypothetical protein [unclassified Pseudomonas]|uniref:hypothetical protein n=1 Tax=unclassified Pseudomonas TaxID=196821 RepID=UPI000A1EFE63|nr:MULTISPECIES: hypothetical protein [unclassified Pseudomonas]MDI2145682.1 hypothetical protein [Pseudomonas sp. ITA]
MSAQARQIFVATLKHHWLRGICSLYGIGRFRLADRKCGFMFCDFVYKTCMHLSQIYASQRSMKTTTDFEKLLNGAKSLKYGRYKLTVRTDIYFSEGILADAGRDRFGSGM